MLVQMLQKVVILILVVYVWDACCQSYVGTIDIVNEQMKAII